MRPPLYITVCDLTQLEIRKVIIQPKSWRAVVYFQHPISINRMIFSASVTFHAKDGAKWYTSFVINASESVVVDKMVELKLKDQLTALFAPYFTSSFLGDRPW